MASKPSRSAPPSSSTSGMASEMIKTAEAAEALGVHPTTLQGWMRKGLVTPDQRTLGGRARFSRRTVAAIARRMRTGSSSPPAPA